jgi:hypothetical protein
LRVTSTSTFVVDLNDNLFEAGDVIEFFFSATNTNGQTSYCSGSALSYVQSDLSLAAEIASEFTILPLDDLTDVLYVDGMDGRAAQVTGTPLSSSSGSHRSATTCADRHPACPIAPARA